MSDNIQELETIGRDVLAGLKTDLSQLLETQGTLALGHLKKVSTRAEELGKAILQKSKDILLQVANEEISQDDGEAALASLWSGLDAIQSGLQDAVKLQAFLRGKETLKSAQRISIGIITAGLTLAAPVAGRIVQEAIDKVIT